MVLVFLFLSQLLRNITFNLQQSIGIHTGGININIIINRYIAKINHTIYNIYIYLCYHY